MFFKKRNPVHLERREWFTGGFRFESWTMSVRGFVGDKYVIRPARTWLLMTDLSSGSTTLTTN